MRIEEGLAGSSAALSVKVFGPDLSDVLTVAGGGEPVSTLVRDQRTYDVLLRFSAMTYHQAEEVGGVLVPTALGSFVPLREVATVTETKGPSIIRRESMGRRLSVECNIAGRDLGSVVEDVRRSVSAIALPAGYYVTYGGQYESAQRAASALMLATGVALFIIFLLLFMALGSAAEAGLILATLPVALVGGVLSLLLSRETLNVSSGVGFIALFGIAVQNGLVLITQARQIEAEGTSLRAAIREASINRLRPKLLTASCAMLGLLPLVITRGVGSEIERPMAIVMIGGLCTSTLFTLLVLPVVYSLTFCRGSAPRSEGETGELSSRTSAGG